MGIKSRVFHLVQYECNPVTGADLGFSEDSIIQGLAHKSFKEWAYILHDKDKYLDEDAKKLNEFNYNLEQSTVRQVERNYELFADDASYQAAYQAAQATLQANTKSVGDSKARHWHVVMRADRAIDVDVVAKWFGVLAQQVEIVKGKDGFLRNVEYLTHESEAEQGKGKHLYNDDEVHANFNFREQLAERAERNAVKQGISSRDYIRYKVLFTGATLDWVRTKYPLEYENDYQYLSKLRAHYIETAISTPVLRLNFYIDGKGGIGKNTASKALAKCLFPNLSGRELYFEVGGNNVNFDKYDGQPVIIWNDKRAATLINQFGRDEVFDLFDSHPTDSYHNIKYGSIKLVHSVNIINGIEPYSTFLDGLAGEYTSKDGTRYSAEDKGQAYRRFPLILRLREEDFDVLLNKGVAEGTREFETYLGYYGLLGSFSRLARTFDGKAKEVVATRMLQPAVDLAEQYKQIEVEKISDPEQIPDEFADWGQPVNPFANVPATNTFTKGDKTNGQDK